MKAVYRNFSLGAIEENIRTLIKDCEIWSDLHLSYEEYEILNEKIEQASNGKLNILQMQKSYPFISVTHAVNFIIYEGYDNFWSAYSNKLGFKLDPQKKSVLGKNWRLIMEKVGFNKFINSFDDMNLLPIMCHVGIPNSEIEDIFNIVNSNEKEEEFNPKKLIRDLISWRGYEISVATKLYLKLYPERAEEYLLNIKELINEDFDTVEIDEEKEEKYGIRTINKYHEWKQEIKYLGNKRSNNVEPPKPYLVYDEENKQFGMVFPPYVVKNEYAHYITYKIVDNDHKRYEGKIKIKGDGQGRYVNKHIVSVEAAKAYGIFCSYDIEETKLIVDKKITGPLGYGAVVYDYKGERIKEIFTEESLGINKTKNLLNINELVFENIRYKENFGKENKSMIYWDARTKYPSKTFILKKLNDYEFIEKIDLTKCRKLKASSGEKHFVYLQNPLKSGLYNIYNENTCGVSNECFTGLKIDNMNIFRHKEDGYKDSVACLNDILLTTLMNYDSIKLLEKIKVIVKETGEKRYCELDDKGCEILTLLICNFCMEENQEETIEKLPKLAGRCALTIKEIIEQISLHMLDARKRAKIIERICNYNLSQEQLEKCFNILNLHVASFEEVCSTPEKSLEKLEAVNDISYMRVCIKNTIDYKKGMKLLGLVGIDGMQQMLQFREKPEDNKAWLSLYEKLITGGLEKSDFKFIPVAKIIGEHEEFHQMVNWGKPGQYRAPEIMFDKKVSEGIHFCGQLYLDVILSWYMRYMKNSEESVELVREITNQMLEVDRLYISLSAEIKNSIVFYEKSLRGRYFDGKSVFSTFYYCGLASVILASSAHMVLDSETYKACDKFLQQMNILFPELVERDLLLADMYVMFNMQYGNI